MHLITTVKHVFYHVFNVLSIERVVNMSDERRSRSQQACLSGFYYHGVFISFEDKQTQTVPLNK